MKIKNYITDEKIIQKLKDEYADTSISMKDLLNGKYKYIPVEDKRDLIYWSCDANVYEVKSNGVVVDCETVEATISKNKLKVWNMSCTSKCLYAVVYAYSLEDAIDKIIEEREEYAAEAERGLWTGEEWTPDMYGGVLLFN